MADGFTSVFGGAPVQTSEPSYALIALTANTQLYWPVEADPSNPVVASQMDVSVAATGLSLAMPYAASGSTGNICCITNVGTFTFTLTDSLGDPIVVIQTGTSWIITLTSNAVTVTYLTDSNGNLVLDGQGQPTITNVTGTGGVWRATQLGATTSNAQAGALAGPGLQADGTELETVILTSYLSAATLIGATYQTKAIVWQGGMATLTLDSLANLGAGWYITFSNEGTAAVTIGTTGGAIFNGGGGTLTIQPGNSGLIVASQLQFDTFGFLPAPLPIANGGTGATTAPGALTNLGGTAIGQSIFTAANQAAVVALLGGPFTALVERTVSTPQTLTAASSGTMFVATTALPIAVPAASTLSTKFLIGIYAYGGAVTFQVQGTDSVPPMAAGTAYVVPQGWSALIFTDGSSNWYVTLSGVPATGGTVTGNVVVTGNLNVDATLAATTADITTTLGVGGNAGVVGSLTVDGATALQSTTIAAATITALTAGNETVTGNLVIDGSTFFSASGSFYASIAGGDPTLAFSAGQYIQYVPGSSVLNVVANGSMAITGTTGLSLNGSAVTVTAPLFVSGTTTFNADVFLNAPLILGAGGSFGGTIAFSSSVFFSGTTTFSGSVFSTANNDFTGSNTFTSVAATSLYVNGAGTFTSTCTASAFVTSSDARAKSEIADLTAEEAVRWVTSGRPRIYLQDGKRSAGFIAQEDRESGRGDAVIEARTIDSRFAESDGHAQPWHRLYRDYQMDIAYLTKALQVALQKIEALEARLATALEKS